jgi:type I restriction enzyme M protein
MRADTRQDAARLITTALKSMPRLHERAGGGDGYDEPRCRIALGDSLAPSLAREQHDVVLTNPPFKGGTGDRASKRVGDVSSNKTELLFTALAVEQMRRGTKSGLLLPESFCWGTTKAHRTLRHTLLNRCTLHCVVSLPGEVFLPHTCSQTCLVVFTKGGTTRGVWLYAAESDGYTLDARRRPAAENDLKDAAAHRAAHAFAGPPREQNRAGKFVYVTAEEIYAEGGVLTPSRFRANEPAAEPARPPGVIIDELIANEFEILDRLQRLKELIYGAAR